MSGSEYLLWLYGQFEKMTFFPPDPLVIGGTASATAAVGNKVPRASRSTVAAFFARMDVRRAAATMAGVTLLSRWRLREQMLDGATRGGGRATRSIVVAMEDDDDGWDLPPPPVRRRRMRRCRCPLRPTTETTKTRARDDATRREGGGRQQGTRAVGGRRKAREWRVMKARRDGGGLRRR